jgi:hypothetical protein
MKKYVVFAFFYFSVCNASAQIGGKSVFQFLKFPISARMEALGGGSQSIKNNDLSLAISNPSLIDSSLHKQIVFSNSFFIDGINYGNLAYAHHHPKIKSTLVYTFQYASYGKFDYRDQNGNSLGIFRASDYNLQVGSANYWNRLYYGLNIKFVISQLANFSSLGLASDLALGYYDTNKNIYFSIMLRNAGIQLKTYNKDQDREKLPLQLDASFAKKFKKLPITLSITAQQLQVWNISFPQEESKSAFGTTKPNKKKEIIDNLFSHIVFGTEIEAGKPVRLRFGYNHLRRRELASTNKKSMAGINAGIGLNIKQFSLDYAFGAYHQAGSDNYLTLKIKLDEFGKKAK